MALHGDIMVNGRVIGSWVARRVNGSAKPDAVNGYAWTVCTRIEGGEPTRVLTGIVRHRYGDGAVALATKVLAAADEQ